MGDLYKKRYAKTRSIAFIFDKEDYPDEIKNLKESGRFSAKRDEMRLAMVTDKKIIKMYKAKYGTSWFPDSSYTTVILKRYDGQVFHLDLLNKHPHMTFNFWLNK